LTTHLEVIEGGLSKFDQQAAKALDGSIRDASRKLTTDLDALLKLLKQAQAGQIHKALGYSSWPAYLADAVRIAPIDKVERKLISALMSCQGMSQRAIAAVLAVDQKTVSNDLRSGEETSSPIATGLDGKGYQREQKPWPDRIRAKLRKFVEEAGESDGHWTDFVAILREELRPMGLNVVDEDSES
jgi:hypothetical protein